MPTVTTFSNKAAAAALAALTLGAGMTLHAGDAEARYGRKGLIAAGVIGALTVGALAASSHNAYAGNGYYADPSYGYAPPAPTYYPQPVYHAPQPQVYYDEPQPVYEYTRPAYGYGYRHREHRQRYAGYSETGMAYKGPNCKLRRQTYFDGYAYRVQKVPVCR